MRRHRRSCNQRTTRGTARLILTTLLHEALVGISRAKLTGESLNANPALLQILGHNSYDELLAKVKKVDNAIRFEPDKALGCEGLLANTYIPSRFELQAYRSDGSTICGCD